MECPITHQEHVLVEMDESPHPSPSFSVCLACGMVEPANRPHNEKGPRSERSPWFPVFLPSLYAICDSSQAA